MAKPVLTKKNQLDDPCLCIWINSLAAPVKTTLIQMLNLVINLITSLIQAMKLVIELVANYDVELKILALQTAVEIEKSIVLPLQAPFALLINMAKPYADCDYVNSMLKVITNGRNKFLGPTEQNIRDIEDIIDELEESKKQIDSWDRYISVLNDTKYMITNLCGV